MCECEVECKIGSVTLFSGQNLDFEVVLCYFLFLNR